jgi:hypothetical protein
MSLFKKNSQLVEVINKLETKIDILNNKFESMTFMDGCCDYRSRENKIYTDLQEYLGEKLLDIKNSLLESVNKNIVICEGNSETDISSDSSNGHLRLEHLEHLEIKLKLAIEEVYNKNRNELIETLQKCCETHTNTNKTDMFNLINSLNQNLGNMLIQIQGDFKSTINEKDISLRTDLQNFIIGVQKDLATNITTQTSAYINHLFDINHQLTKHIKDLEELSLKIDSNVSSFYYDNEIIKHQLQLSEEVRKYSDEVENLRELATNARLSIDKLLDNYDFDE